MSADRVPTGAPSLEAPRRRDASVLVIGSLLAGVLAYVFFAVATRSLGAGPAAGVAVLWAWWGFAGAAVTFPIQHWVARSSETTAGEAAVRGGLSQVAAGVVTLSLLAGGLSWLYSDALFGPDGAVFALLVVAVGLGSGLIGLLRGTLSGRRRFTAVALSLVGENALRCAIALGLAGLGSDDPLSYALALLAGYGVVAIWAPALLPGKGLPKATVSGGSSTTLGGTGGPVGPLNFLSASSAAQFMAQATLTGGPVLLAVIGGTPAQVTALFATFALLRAPYTVALGLVSALTGRLTRLVHRRRYDTLRRLRRTLVAFSLAMAVVAAAGGAWLAPPLIEFIFGGGIRLGAFETALVAVGSVFALANLTLTIGSIARNRPAAVLVSWVVAAPLVTCALVGDDRLRSTCWAFLAIEVVAFTCLVALESRSDRLVSGEEHRGAER